MYLRSKTFDTEQYILFYFKSADLVLECKIFAGKVIIVKSAKL